MPSLQLIVFQLKILIPDRPAMKGAINQMTRK